MQVDLHGVGHRFGGGAWLFRNLDETLIPGHVYALTGPSGSGKSTLLSMLAGWEKPTEGSIQYGGTGRTAWVFQNPHGVPGRSARDHVALPLLAHGNSYREASEEASRLLDRFGLLHAENRPFRALSGGEAQRLMLARGFASKPSLFLVDEPTAQLDLSTSSEVNSSLSKLADDNVTVVVATHDEQTRNACTDLIDLRLFQDPGSDGINQ